MGLPSYYSSISSRAATVVGDSEDLAWVEGAAAAELPPLIPRTWVVILACAASPVLVVAFETEADGSYESRRRFFRALGRSSETSRRRLRIGSCTSLTGAGERNSTPKPKTRRQKRRREATATSAASGPSSSPSGSAVRGRTRCFRHCTCPCSHSSLPTPVRCSSTPRSRRMTLLLLPLLRRFWMLLWIRRAVPASAWFACLLARFIAAGFGAAAITYKSVGDRTMHSLLSFRPDG